MVSATSFDLEKNGKVDHSFLLSIIKWMLSDDNLYDNCIERMGILDSPLYLNPNKFL